MFKKTITYVDYDGNEREEDFYFNLDERDITKMELGTTGGLDQYIKKISAEKDLPKIIELFEDLIDASYGEKSADGKYFMKTAEALMKFKSTQAYSDLYMELATDENAAAEFINGITPKEKKQPEDHKKSDKVTNIADKQ